MSENGYPGLSCFGGKIRINDVLEDRKHGEVKRSKSQEERKDVKDRRAIHDQSLNPCT